MKGIYTGKITIKYCANEKVRKELLDKIMRIVSEQEKHVIIGVERSESVNVEEAGGRRMGRDDCGFF